MSVGWIEIIAILATALIVFGAKDLPGFLEDIGRCVGSVRKLLGAGDAYGISGAEHVSGIAGSVEKYPYISAPGGAGEPGGTSNGLSAAECTSDYPGNDVAGGTDVALSVKFACDGSYVHSDVPAVAHVAAAGDGVVICADSGDQSTCVPGDCSDTHGYKAVTDGKGS